MGEIHTVNTIIELGKRERRVSHASDTLDICHVNSKPWSDENPWRVDKDVKIVSGKLPLI